jgi:predicted nucleic-acid-binding Zn-ribbon protein
MHAPWKVIVCPSDKCQLDVFQEDGSVKEGKHITPDVDTEYMTQFTCGNCGYVETWGPTRRMVALTLYERYHHV